MIDTKRVVLKKQQIAYPADRISELKKRIVYYKEITDTVREPFIVLDNELRVVSANVAFYRLFKVLKKNTVGQRIYNLGNNQWNAPELIELLDNILPEKKVLRNYDVTHDFPGIGRKTIRLSARRVDHKQLILMALDDVTDQKRLKREAKELTENLIKQRDQLRKLSDAKDEFISLASHQLRTPATVVKQYTGMLTHGYAGYMSKDQTKMLNIINKSNERQLEIIEDLLRVAKVDAGKVYLSKTSCDLAKQVQVVIKSQLVLFKERKQEVIFHKPLSRVLVDVDQKLMLMVIENLLDNAGKYSHPGGKIIIRISQTPIGSTLSVRDSGVGITKRDQGKLFKKFSRIDNPLSINVHGTGLGLYWVKKIIDLHDARIDVISKINKGSIFTVTVPNVDQPDTVRSSIDKQKIIV